MLPDPSPLFPIPLPPSQRPANLIQYFSAKERELRHPNIPQTDESHLGSEGNESTAQIANRVSSIAREYPPLRWHSHHNYVACAKLLLSSAHRGVKVSAQRPKRHVKLSPRMSHVDLIPLDYGIVVISSMEQHIRLADKVRKRCSTMNWKPLSLS